MISLARCRKVLGFDSRTTDEAVEKIRSELYSLARLAVVGRLTPLAEGELEGLLAHLGFDPGSVDGVLDARTRTAIKGYQDFAALPVSGQASSDLLDELRSVTESLDAVRIPEGAPRAVTGLETAKAQETVTQPVLVAPKPPRPQLSRTQESIGRDGGGPDRGYRTGGGWRHRFR